ncbi:hypothetical protein V6O07_03465 [Arthrospira platensis SPKY2]
MKPIEGVILMMKQSALAVALSTALVLSVPAIGKEPISSDEEKLGFRDRVTGMVTNVRQNTVDLKDGLFNSDERLKRAEAQIETQKVIIAELQNELTNLRIRTDVEHIQMIQASERVTAYLKSLTQE